MPNPILVAAIGGLTGYLAGFLGAGGGFATVVLFMAVGIPVHSAIGTSLAFTLPIGLWGTILHFRQATISTPLAMSLGLPSIVTAVFGAQLSDALPAQTLTIAFGVLTGVVFVALSLQPRLMRPSKRSKGDDVASGSNPSSKEKGGFEPTFRWIAVAVVGGAVIGVLRGLFGVGGGFLLIPFMLLFLKISEHIAVGSSLFAILLGAIAGAARHATLGNVDAVILLWAVPTGLIGSFAGVRTTAAVKAPTIRRIFMTLMLASTVYLLTTSL